MASSQRNKTLSKNTMRLANEARQIISNNTPFHVFFITPSPFFFLPQTLNVLNKWQQPQGVKLLTWGLQCQPYPMAF